MIMREWLIKLVSVRVLHSDLGLCMVQMFYFFFFMCIACFTNMNTCSLFRQIVNGYVSVYVHLNISNNNNISGKNEIEDEQKRQQTHSKNNFFRYASWILWYASNVFLYSTKPQSVVSLETHRICGGVCSHLTDLINQSNQTCTRKLDEREEKKNKLFININSRQPFRSIKFGTRVIRTQHLSRNNVMHTQNGNSVKHSHQHNR